MKAVVLKIGILILIHLTTSCQKSILDSKKNKSIIINQQVSDSDSIVTNSLKPNFIYDLIETKKVPVGDTILFRNWLASKSKPIGIYDNKIYFIDR